MADRTWEQRELPILESVAQIEVEGRMYRTDTGTIADMVGIDRRTTGIALRSLLLAGYIEGASEDDAGGSVGVSAPRLLERGRRAVGQWPQDNAFDDLLALLEARIEEAEPERRGKLVKARDGLLTLGRDVGVEVLGAFLTGRAGL